MIQIEEMKIYILNTTRFYHEDFEEYPGAWFSCPVNFEEIRERLGVQSEEEIEIEDYELPFPLEGNTRLWEINALCRMVQEVQLFGEVHPDLLNHIDYASIGRELETSENYLFTDNGIFYYR